MTARRYATTFPTPARTGGEDRPEPACQGRPEPYDVLVDQTSGPAFHAALRVARDICGGCPLAAQCLFVDNRGERWARAILGEKAPEVVEEPVRRGRINAAHNRERAERMYQERVEELRHLISGGADVTEALRALGIAREALYTWCRRNNHGDMWKALTAGGSQSKRGLAA